MTKLFFLVAGALCVAAGASSGGGGDWEHIGPWNLFDDKDNKGEAGTLASAASSAAQPNIIYAGGANNGASSGILKTVDGGVHWTRNSNGIWDTRINGVWIHPDDASSDHVFAGTSSGIYESTDGAASWKLFDESKDWGNVMSFREGVIDGEKYIFANSHSGILTLPYAGGTWNVIHLPEGASTLAHNAELSVVTTDGKTEAVMCTGEWQGGDLYYLAITSPTNGTWTGPIGDSKTVRCCSVAVSPSDRNHLVFTAAGEYRAYSSKDGGKTSEKIPTDFGVFFVMMDAKDNLYIATASGAFVSHNAGKNWSDYQAVMHPRAGGIVERGPHDYQRIVPFHGDGIAFPSDQGLHLVNPDGNLNLTNVMGDMSNCIVMGLSVAPGDQDGPRKLVVTMWDWSSSASWDDGATWPSWNMPKDTDIVNPNTGEGGGNMNLGASGHTLMYHSTHDNKNDCYNCFSWHSANGGKNLTRVRLKRGIGGIAYLRQQGSRSEPSGTVFAFPSITIEEKDCQELPPPPDSMDEDFDDSEEELESGASTSGDFGYILVSEDFGVTWPVNHTLPDSLQGASQMTTDPTADVLFIVSSTCLANSTDKGTTWGPCSYTPTLHGEGSPAFSSLVVISSDSMFLMRSGGVPLRTTDGGHTWTELTSAAPLFKYAGLSMSVSWSGKTLVLHGSDQGAIGRGEFGTQVWKSTDNGDSWSDETGDIVTISLGAGTWYEKDFYLTSGGEGIMVKRNFEA